MHRLAVESVRLSPVQVYVSIVLGIVIVSAVCHTTKVIIQDHMRGIVVPVAAKRNLEITAADR